MVWTNISWNWCGSQAVLSHVSMLNNHPGYKLDVATQFLLIESVHFFLFSSRWVWQHQICFLFSAFSFLSFIRRQRTYKKGEMKNYFTNTKNLTETERGRKREIVENYFFGSLLIWTFHNLSFNVLKKKNSLPKIARNKTSMHGCCCCYCSCCCCYCSCCCLNTFWIVKVINPNPIVLWYMCTNFPMKSNIKTIIKFVMLL